MPASITSVQAIATELVLQERLTTTEFVVVEIHENIANRTVSAEVELGPFTEETGPLGTVNRRGSSRRGIQVWSGDAYDAVRETWTNADLLTAVAAALAAN
jgi:hypothetical protein